ncbi:hypothetical protein, partial [Acinetobacter baumannii]|uniref:hypothetical protein n=1 Tax=Acinetobacter baumannii TaxID=470 RepID=UPI0013D06C2E
PWSRRILPRMRGRQRIVARQVSPGNAALAASPITRLALAKYPGIGKADAATVGNLITRAVALDEIQPNTMDYTM